MVLTSSCSLNPTATPSGLAGRVTLRVANDEVVISTISNDELA